MQSNKNKQGELKAEITIQTIRFFKNNWGIVVASVDKVLKGELQTDAKATVFKGDMPQVKEGEGYKITAKYVEDPKWGGQYALEVIGSNITFNDNDEDGKRKFLQSIFTDNQVAHLYSTLPDPFKALKDKDLEALVKVKGCSLRKAPDWILRFHQNYHRAKIVAELDDYNLSTKIIDKLIERYKSPELVIEKIKSNPYILITDVKGIGWATADNIALAGGMGEFSEERIGAYIYQYLYDKAESGFSWITTDELMGGLLEKFGEEIPDEAITNAVHNFGDELWWNEEKTRIGLRYYYNLEDKIAKELLRIKNAKSKFSYPDWEDAVKRIERLQGWEYTEEQKQGIKKALDYNIIMIQGSAGTGKTSLVWAVIEVLKGYKFVQCALSGKAASRLMEVTREEGYTIHRLLQYPKGPVEKQKFFYNDENQLPYDIIIVDEISMVDLKLFYYLLRAVADGSKVICLGDNGQLEAIGSGNIAYDMLSSTEIPSVTLTKIHRQAENSAIITESIKIRNKYQIISKDWVGHEVRGALKDLDITCYSDRTNTYHKIIEYFNEIYKTEKDIRNIQIIVPTKARGCSTYVLNLKIQEIYNPNGKHGVVIQSAKDQPYEIREGDRVINTQNNYKTEPNIYNGNVGIVKKIYWDDDEDDNVMLIYFEGIGDVKVIEDYWKNIELSYAITGHKSQGGQWDYVIFGLDFSSYSLLSKELVYTGITRAKKKCYLVAETGALRYATANSSVIQKQTHLQERLYELAHPKLVF